MNTHQAASSYFRIPQPPVGAEGARRPVKSDVSWKAAHEKRHEVQSRLFVEPWTRFILNYCQAMKILRLLQLDLLPRSVDAGLLVLRLWLGLSLLLLHGWSKLSGFSQMSAKFPDPLGIGSPTSL